MNLTPLDIEKVEKLGHLMASISNIVPKHFADNEEACIGIIMQAGKWGMDPFSLAQHTYMRNNVMCYESKVIQSVLQASAGIKFTAEWIGDWSKVRGNTKEIDGRRFPNWTHNESGGLAIKLTGDWGNYRKETITLKLNDANAKIMVNWANDPEQQLFYAAIKKFGRQFEPDLLMGVFDAEDID